MAFFRQYVAPFLIVLIFVFAFFVMSSRAFLPSDMMLPAPVGFLGSAINVKVSPMGF